MRWDKMANDIEPLPSDLWFDRIEMIANGELKNTERGLRHALHLLQLTPRECRPPEYDLIDEEGFEALLAKGDLDAAARRLVAAPTLHVSTRSVGETVEAAITCSTTAQTITGTGDTFAEALLQAWARCLMMMRSDLGLTKFEELMTH